MKKEGHYNISGLIEAQFDTGSRGRVLKNKFGIKSKHAGLDNNYEPMEKIFDAVIHRTLRTQK